MENLQRWRASRKAHRAHLTKLHRTVTEIMNSEERPLESQLDTLSTSIEKFQRKAKAIEELDAKIAGELQDSQELEEDIYEAVELQEGITDQIGQIKRFVSRQASPFEPHPPSGNSSRQSSSLSATAHPFVPQDVVANPSEDGRGIQNQVLFPSSGSHGSMASQASVSRLPKLNLPSFSGDPLCWQTFWDSFSAAVDSSPALSGVQKFNYLRTLLQGEAARAVAGFPLTDANYSHSVEILKERFGQTQKIVNAHMQSLLNLPNPRNTLTDLRAFYDSTESHIRGLSSLGITPESYGALLIPVTLGKLPADVRRNLAREQNRSDWSIEELREALLREIRILEQGIFTPTTYLPDTLPMMTASLYTGTRGSQPRQSRSDRGMLNKKFTCAYCKGTHATNNCDVVVGVEKRLEFVKREGLCFNCLGRHRVSQCTSQGRCKRCNNKHHTSICGAKSLQPMKKASNTQSSEKNPQQLNVQKEHTTQSTETNQAAQVTKTNVPVNTTIALNDTHSVCLLKTAVATVVSDADSATANILFDEGAQRSFITKKLANTLRLTPQRHENISLAPFGADASSIQCLEVANVTIVSHTGEKIPLSVLVVPKIAAALQCVASSKIRELPYLRHLTLAHPMSEDKQFDISLLIGVDYYWEIVGNDVIRGNGPTAVQSKLGYLLSGPLHLPSSYCEATNISHVNVNCHSEDNCNTMERFWAIESTGTLPTVTKESDTFMDTYLSSVTRLNDGSYMVKFPWKDDHAPLPSNLQVCERRIRSLARRLIQTPNLMKSYNEIIKEQERRRFIEKVNSGSTPVQAHYVPHHPVRKESSTTPIRIVYDCSCRMSEKHPSLNDCLEVGPSLVNDICSILLRFRIHKFGLSTDIEKAFLHVKLDEADRDFTRFLWLSNPEDPNSELDVYRFKVVLFGSVSSPFMLNATLRLHLRINTSEVAKDMSKNLYVDNIVSGGTTEQSVTQYFREARRIMSKANFNLRSWASNSQCLQTVAQEEKVADENKVVSVLGLHWNTAEDKLSFIPKKIDSTANSTVTKRKILQYSSKIFDPLGFLSPITIRAKLLIQELWQKNMDWDENLDEATTNKWNEIADDLQATAKATIQRCYFTHSYSDKDRLPQLHVFADASTKAYGAVVYIQQGNETTFVIAKARVAPLKQLTLPKLELMAALVATRLAKFVVKSFYGHFDGMSIQFWSDSQIVLHWLHSQKKLKQFISNRIKEINQTMPNAKWGYCPTKDNPADLLTRGISYKAFESSFWMEGPTWLKEKSNWPKWNRSEVLHLNVEPNQLQEENQTETTEVIPLTQSTGIHKIINISNYSSLTKLLNITGYVLRFLANMKNLTSRQTGPLSVKEMTTAQFTWILSCQQERFHKEIQNLKLSPNIKTRLPLVRQLQLYLDKGGYLRCGGRIHNAPLSESTRFPFLLPSKHPLTALIILATHAAILHGGVNSTVTALRQKFWIPSARQYVKSILRSCVTCRRVCGKPYSTPDPPPLPKIRTQQASPFTVTGVDFSGALYVHGMTGEEKVYVCLFTCGNTRAVHLEIVNDLSENSFLQAFRRFASRKSLPSIMISDNASTYLSAAKEIEELMNSVKIHDTLKVQGTSWKFIPKRAPWYGGFWERLIGLTKSTLKKVLGRTFVSLISLQTVIVEIEAALNDRPLTYVSSDMSDPEPLTPAHLLYGRRIISLPYPRMDKDESDDPSYCNPSDKTTRILFSRQAQIFEHFQNRWRQEYLTSLREYHKTTGKNDQSVKTGDVVLIHDDVPRTKWKMAVIEQLIRGNDGYVRAATIRYNGGRTNRPISKLYPLEVSSIETVDQNSIDDHDKDNQGSNVADQITRQSTRSSAMKAKGNIANWTKMLLSPAPEDVEK